MSSIPAEVTFMSRDFDREDYENRDAAWARKAEYKGWRCKACKEIPPLSEAEIFFETGLCGRPIHPRSHGCVILYL